MSDINKLRKNLPPMEGEFDIEVEGEITKKRYLGTFSCKLMNKKEQAFVNKHKAMLNGPYGKDLDLITLRFHHRVAYLRYALVEPYPKFWKTSDLGYELYDGNVVDAVYEKVLEWEEQWMREVWGDEAVDALKGDDSGRAEEADGDSEDGEPEAEAE